MIQKKGEFPALDLTLITASLASLASVVFANVIRVEVSPGAAVATRTVLFSISWIAALAWAIAKGNKQSRAWLGFLAASGVLLAICQHYAGGMESWVMTQLIGPGGAGLGVALFLKRALEEKRAHWTASLAALAGCGAALWLAFEPSKELWKLLPNDWELSKNLEYRWGIRMGQDRARFLFDTPMEAGVVQWVLGTVALATAMTPALGRKSRWLFGFVAVLLYASVALTYSRAGLVLGCLSIGLAILMMVRTRRKTVVAVCCVALVVIISAVAANRLAPNKSPALKNIASIFDPGEEANRIRLGQIKEAGLDLSETPWHGNGASAFITYLQAPRTDEQRARFKRAPLMPEHESTPVGLLVAFGIGGGVFSLVFVWLFVRNTKPIAQLVVDKTLVTTDSFARFIAISLPPFACYSLVAPILSGITFGMICFTLAGTLAIWEPPLRRLGGNP